MEKKRYDVVVCGGGTAGTVAAIAAARNGAQTLLIEKEQWLGGIGATGFFPHSFFANGSGKRAVGGIPEEIVQRLQKMGGSLGHIRFEGGHLYAHTPVDHEIKRVLLMDMLRESGAELLLDTIVNEVRVENGRISAVVAQNKGGAICIEGKTFIDATGDGDVAAHAGAPFEKGRADGKMQPCSLNMRLTNVDMIRFAQNVPTDKQQLWIDRPSGRRTPIYYVGRLGQWDDTPEAQELFTDKNHQLFCLCVRENDIIANISRLIGMDSTSVDQVTAAAVTLREQIYKVYCFLKKYVPGFEQCNLIGGSTVGFRESRRFIGKYTLTEDDCLNGRMFDDNIGLACYPLDMHDPDGGNVVFRQIGGDGSYGIPYRCMLPQGIENLLIAGRCISATHTALASVRSIAACETMGQAAGTAAALAVKATGGCTKAVDITLLQKALSEQDVILK